MNNMTNDIMHHFEKAEELLKQVDKELEQVRDVAIKFDDFKKSFEEMILKQKELQDSLKEQKFNLFKKLAELSRILKIGTINFFLSSYKAYHVDVHAIFKVNSISEKFMIFNASVKGSFSPLEDITLEDIFRTPELERSIIREFQHSIADKLKNYPEIIYFLTETKKNTILSLETLDEILERLPKTFP
ncbi:MAG: hypothetical protein JWM20_764 [Patescibacteria group bacterium]|nr:hypothetical protein [Patescibacteria group bacterium]